MNLVPKNINESIKHLTPRSEEELEAAWMNRLEELYEMDPSEVIDAIYEEVRDFGTYMSPVTKLKIAAQLFGNVDAEQRKEAISIVMNDYFFG